jgi:hypothetical protein
VTAEGVFGKIDGDIFYASEANGTVRIINVLAGENVTAGNAVYINLSDGKAYISDTGTAGDIRFTGFAIETISSGNAVNVQTGGIFSGLSGLTARARYYIGASGAISTTQNNVMVGVATSTTALMILPKNKFTMDAPIGTVLPWLKTLTGCPALPANWVECSGQTLSDAESLFNGQVIPNLNGNINVLKGASTSGGTSSENYLPSHTHAHSATHTHYFTATHNHQVYVSNTDGTNICGCFGGGGSWTSAWVQAVSAGTSDATAPGTSDATTAGTATTFYNVVYIIRIK